MENTNNFLIVVDMSYWMYYTIYGAVSTFQKRYPEEASIWLKPLDDIEPNNIPNILNCESFKKVLKTNMMNKCETIDWLAKQNCQDKIDSSDDVDIVFATDDRLVLNFRKKIYPEYKAQRILKKTQFQIKPVKDYILNVLWDSLELSKKYGYKIISSSGAEGDDVIACLLRNFKTKYNGVLLIASDRDFLQLDEDILQIDMLGRIVERKLGGEKLTSKQYLLSKILLGDVADNINKVFHGYGEKKVLKLIKDIPRLKLMLKNDQDASKQYIMNKKLISFDEIPEDLEKEINENINVSLYKNKKMNNDDIINLTDFLTL